MNSWDDAPWRGGRAGGYFGGPLEGDPSKGSTSKSIRGPPNHATRRARANDVDSTQNQALFATVQVLSTNLGSN